MKRFVFYLALAAIVAVVCEAVSRVGLTLIAAPTLPGMPSAQSFPALEQEMLHPYLGYTYNPDKPAGGGLGLAITPLGFLDENRDPPIVRRSADTVVVGIFGGSVAYQLSRYSADALARELGDLPGLGHRRVVLVRTALGGYKEPQQLFALTYLLALGAEFDVLINIDGFNEVALAGAENIPGHVSVVYPRAWQFRIGLADTGLQELVGRAAYVRAIGGRFHAFTTRWPLCHSATVRLVARCVERYLADRLESIRLEAVARPQVPTHGAEIEGPPAPPGDPYAAIADTWARSSVQLSRLCAANGIRYFHFLQPNQYDDGSKPLNAEERMRAFDAKHVYREGVVRGYPLLIAAGHRLDSRGVAFDDLTRLFAGRTETLYDDTCCHMNARGYELLAGAITTFIRAHWESHAHPA